MRRCAAHARSASPEAMDAAEALRVGLINEVVPHDQLLERAGPDHAARFTVEVRVHNVGTAQASANSKQAAEKLAAAEFLRKFG